MRVCVYGTGFVNKGAELMLRAIMREVRGWTPDVTIGSHLRMGTGRQRRSLDIWHAAEIGAGYLGRSRLANWAVDKVAAAIPASARRAGRILRLGEIELMLDASGFAYADSWGHEKAEAAAARYERARAAGTQVVLLPQSFGPIRHPRVRSAMQRILASSTLVFPRDRTSLSELRELNGSTPHLELAPDFTTLLEGTQPEWAGTFAGRPCVVPNLRMMDKTTADTADWYIRITRQVLTTLQRHGLTPFILVHEVDDRAFASALGAEFSVPVVADPDPVGLKGILGNASMVHAARYHALIGSLSQAVPTLGAGWSHKYAHLFDDYGVGDCLIPTGTSCEDVDRRVTNLVTDEALRSTLRSRLRVAAADQKRLASEMWEKVREAGEAGVDGLPDASGESRSPC